MFLAHVTSVCRTVKDKRIVIGDNNPEYTNLKIYVQYMYLSLKGMS